MGSKPKPQDYKPSETEKTQAAIAAEEQRYFEQTYQPLFIKQMQRAAERKLAPTFRGRAQADTMQALTGSGPQLGVVSGVSDAADRAMGAVSNIAASTTQAAKASQSDQMNSLSQSLGLGSAASSGLASASRQAASRGLAEAQAKQQVRMAKNDALFSAAKAGLSMGMSNIASGGSFFKGKQIGVDNKTNKLMEYDTNFFGKRIT
tara:strand:- start:31 stop:645 length:615 start_codon:yes stop_codon:yes gene_type:complete